MLWKVANKCHLFNLWFGLKLCAGGVTHGWRWKRRQLRQESLHEGVMTKARKFLAEEELQVAQKVLDSGALFKAKTDNSVRQRAAVWKAVALRGCGSAGNPLKEAGRVQVLNRKELEKDAKMLNMEKREDVRWNWREVVVYYYGSAEHKPDLPDIDANLEEKIKLNKLKRRQKRPVEWRVVTQDPCLQVVDNSNGVLMENAFKKLPVRVGGKKVEDLFQCLKDIEAECGQSTCRVNTEGERVAALEGPAAYHINLGTNQNLYGPGLKQKHVDAMEDTVFKCFLSQVMHYCKDHMPWSVRKVFAAAWKVARTDRGLMAGMDSGKGLNEFWSGLVMGRNVFLNAHKEEKDHSWAVVLVIAEDTDDDVVRHFVFPELGVAVPMRSGDLILFNPKHVHCVAARCNPKVDDYCMSFYLPAAVVGGNKRVSDSGVILEDERAGEAIMKIAKAIDSKKN